jgi:membrane associated rhomboid family serine protease
MNHIRPNGFQVLPPVTKNILIICGLLFAATYIAQGYNIDLQDALGLHFPFSYKFKVYQIITHLLMHGSIGHLFFNMLSLWMFGSVLENLWGSKKYFNFFLISGLGAAFMHYLIMYMVELQPTVQLIDAQLVGADSLQKFNLEQEKANFMAMPNILGASGGIAGILVAFAYLFPNSEIYLYFLLPVKAKYAAIAYVVYELYQAIQFNPMDNVAHFAHLGGMLFGFLMVKFFHNDKFY